jgi:NSS family neurotransmitter:Na+ symporter
MPIAALLFCIVIGYIVKPSFLIEEIELNGQFKSKKLFSIMIKYVSPVCLIIILASSILDVFGILKI